MTQSKKQQLANWLAPLATRMRTDVSAIKTPDGSRWTKDPLDNDALVHHVNGGPWRGASPIKPGESVTMVGLFDFDSHKGESTWDELINCVRAVYYRLEDLGYHPIPFRSSGGNGVHLYLLWDEPQDARSVRVAMREVLLGCNLIDGTKGVAAKQVEVFPKQDSVGEGDYGNQFILPLANLSVPLEPLADFAPLDRDDALTVEWVFSQPVPVLDTPADGSGKGKQQVVNKAEWHDIVSAVEAIPNSGDDELDYEEWRNLVFAIHAGTGGSTEGLELAHKLSRKSSKYDKSFLDKRTWKYIKPVGTREKSVSVQTLFAKARRYGWTEHVEFEPLPAVIDAETGREIPDQPRLKLTRDKLGRIESTLVNIVTALSNPSFSGVRLAEDRFRCAVMVCCEFLGETDWRPIKDRDYSLIRHRFESVLNFKALSLEYVRAAIDVVCRDNTFDSAQDWLDSLTWDGVPRVESFFTNYFGCADSEYVRAVSLYTWTALAGRILDPGVQADMVPILTGGQGLRKTSGVRAMAPTPQLFATVNLADKDENLLRRIRGKCVAELGELRGLHTKDLDSIKSFITERIDEWTEKYKEHITSYPRRVIFIGTTNQSEFLSDNTGHRRFLPMECAVTSEFVDVDGIDTVRDQLWAEGAALFMANGVDYADAERLAKAEHGKHVMSHHWEDLIGEWLETASFGQGSSPKDQPFLKAEAVTAGALKMEFSRFNRFENQRLKEIVESFGYKRDLRRVDGVVTRAFFKVKRDQ